MSRTADQRETAIEAIERSDATWSAFLTAVITGEGAIDIAYDVHLEARRAVAKALPL